MPRTFVPAVLAAVALATAVPSADAARERVTKVPYRAGANVAGVTAGDTDLNGQHYGAARLPIRRGDSRVQVSATDDAGLPVAFEVGQDLDGDGMSDVEVGPFCGAMPEAVRIKPGRDVTVYVLAGSCGSGASVPTSGTVTARIR